MLIRRTIGIVVLLVLLGGVVYGLREAERRVFGGGSSPGAEVTVTIPKGSSTAAIGAILEKAKVVDSASRFELEAFSETGLQAGTYVLHVNDGYDRAIAALKAGPPIRPTKQLLIPEGLAARDVAELTPKVGLKGADYEAAAKAAKPPAGFLTKDEKAATIEGFLFPATYDVPQPPSGTELVDQQLARVRVELRPGRHDEGEDEEPHAVRRAQDRVADRARGGVSRATAARSPPSSTTGSRPR